MGRPHSRTVISFVLQLPPAAGTIVGNDGFALADGNGAGGRVVAACGDDSLGIGDDGAVIQEGVDMVLRRQQGGDVALENEVWTVGAFDGLGDLWICGVDQIADLMTDGLLPVGQGIDVDINARVGVVGHGFHDSHGGRGWAV